MLHLNSIGVGDSLSFDLAWEVVVDKSGADVGALSGVHRIVITRWENLGALKADVKLLSSKGDNYNGGGATIPTVSFTVVSAAPDYIGITVASTLALPVAITVRTKVSNFRATGTPQMKAA